MHRRQRLLAGAAALAMLAAPAIAAEEQSGKLHTITGHVFRPEPRPATDELIATLTLPDGFRLQVYARDLGNPRMMAMAAIGTLYVTRPASNDVVALADRDGDGRPMARRRWSPPISTTCTASRCATAGSIWRPSTRSTRGGPWPTARSRSSRR